MNTKSIAQSTNPVLAGSLPALQRSAKRAKKLAEQTGTRLIVAKKPTAPKAWKPRSAVTR